MCRLCVCGSVHVQPCVPERMNFYIRRRKIIASERTERANLPHARNNVYIQLFQTCVQCSINNYYLWGVVCSVLVRTSTTVFVMQRQSCTVSLSQLLIHRCMNVRVYIDGNRGAVYIWKEVIYSYT